MEALLRQLPYFPPDAGTCLLLNELFCAIIEKQINAAIVPRLGFAAGGCLQLDPGSTDFHNQLYLLLGLAHLG